MKLQAMTCGLLLLAAVASCGPVEEGGLALKVYYYTPPGTQALRADPPPAGEAPTDITDYRICVSAPDMGKVHCENFVRDANPTRARLSGLPVGSDRKVTFQGYSQPNFVSQWCGEVSGITIRNGATTQVSMYLSACSNFTPTRNTMGSPRAFHTATPMPDGRVLVVGGFNSMSAEQDCDVGRCFRLSATSAIDIYDPRTGSFDPEATAGLALAIPRAMHTATLLPGGRVLLAGGVGQAYLRTSFPSGPRPVLEVDPTDSGQAGSTAEVINMLTLTVESADPIPLAPATPRAHHAALTMAGGDVLVLGGIVPSTNAPLRSMGRYQAAANAFLDLQDRMIAARQGMALIPFGSGSHLLWGGSHAEGGGPGQFAEIVSESAGEPTSRTPFFVTNDPGNGQPLFYGAGVAMGDDRALLAGGMILDTSYDPSLTNKVRPSNMVRMVDLQEGNETFVPLSSGTINFPRALHAMVALPDFELYYGTGQPTEIATAAVFGGVVNYTVSSPSYYQLTNRVEFFVAERFQEKQAGAGEIWMNAERAGHAVTPLPDNTYLITGGLGCDGTSDVLATVLDSAEVFNLASRELQVR